ncbi:MAG: prepilin peptidase [Desulfobulbaceae bacterium]|nr:prepilin peptidase [Desulfobulbaceae bacterium]
MTTTLFGISSHHLLLVFLAAVLSVASITDIRSRKIPNFLTFPTILAGLMFHLFTTGFDGLFYSLKGLGLGFALLIPFYAGGGMGAGDVKLMSAVGAVVGAGQVFTVFLLTTISGGIYALVLMLIRGTLKEELQFVACLMWQAVSGGGLAALKIQKKNKSDMRYTVPYGLAIACGTSASFFWSL